VLPAAVAAPVCAGNLRWLDKTHAHAARAAKSVAGVNIQDMQRGGCISAFYCCRIHLAIGLRVSVGQTEWLKWYSFFGRSIRSYGASPAILWDHTVLPATRHRLMHPAISPAMQTGTRFTYPRGMKG